MNFPVPSQLAGTFLCPALMQSQFGKAQTGRDDALAAVGAPRSAAHIRKPAAGHLTVHTFVAATTTWLPGPSREETSRGSRGRELRVEPAVSWRPSLLAAIAEFELDAA